MPDVAPGFALFDTPLGRCGIVWGGRGVRGVQLPERSEQATRARLARRFGVTREASPPPGIRRAVEAMTALLRGEDGDLSAVALDMTGVPPFDRRVYEVARTIPPGATLSYGEIASRLGCREEAREVGRALGSNPFAIIVPCHRVVAAGGKLGGFSAAGGAGTKRRLLAIEGARPSGLPLFDGDRRHARQLAAAVAHLRAADPVLGRLIDAVGPCRLELRRTTSLFLALLEAIVYQQLNGKAAATIHGRVCALFPRSPVGPTAQALLRIPDDRLRGAGLSRPKMQALRDLARRVADGTLPTLEDLRDMEDEAIIERLTLVHGIGRWTAEMLLIFRLGRPDVLPLDDYGMRRGFAVAFRRSGLPSPAEIERRGARWRPHRSVACWYLWRAADGA
jgi:O-6-methylguanine DNA methyltransferase